MSWFKKAEQGYESLWKMIIRPERTRYQQSHLGPSIFTVSGKQVRRFDTELMNPRGLTFTASLFAPISLQKYPCVIYSHGNCSNKLEGTQYLQQLIKQGIALITYDFTGCGNAEGDYITLGWEQWDDLAQVVMYLLKRPDITNIGLWGRSMGAVTSLMYLRQDKIIKAAVFDSPFYSLKTVILDLCKNNSSVPEFVVTLAMKVISKTIENKASFDIYKHNPGSECGKITCPGLFITALEDLIVSTEQTKEVFKAYGGKKRLAVVEGDHNTNRPSQTIREVIKFLKGYLVEKKEGEEGEEGKKVEKEKEKDDFEENNSTENQGSQDEKVFEEIGKQTAFKTNG